MQEFVWLPGVLYQTRENMDNPLFIEETSGPVLESVHESMCKSVCE